MGNGDHSRDRMGVLKLDSDSADIAAVRRWARAFLPGLDEDDLADVLLVVTELVSNVYDHGRFPARLELRSSTHPCAVRIAVEDASPSPPQLREFSPDAARGRGLILVDRLTEQWGVTQLGAGKSVWAVLPCAGKSR